MPKTVQPKTLSLFLQLGVCLTSTPQVKLPFVRVLQYNDGLTTTRTRSVDHPISQTSLIGGADDDNNNSEEGCCDVFFAALDSISIPFP